MTSFCPLILFHDNPSEQLYKTLTANKQHDQTAIHRHLHKINEMLEINAQYWTTHHDDEEEEEADNSSSKVSPSTTTSSSSSSGDSSSHRHFYFQQQQHHQQRKSKSTPTSTTTTTTDITKKRRRGNLPKEVTEFLRKWLIQHKKHPYPAEKEKADLARLTGLTVNQISNWFINARRRILQPMLESENLNAQYNMTYPEMGFEQHRHKRQQDFYGYQREFAPSLPDHYHHATTTTTTTTTTTATAMSTSSDEESSIYNRRRLMDIDEHYQQLPMR